MKKTTTAVALFGEKGAVVSGKFEMDVARARTAVFAAMESLGDARQKCLAAGAVLNEIKGTNEHGEFLRWIEDNIPEIAIRTAQVWMQAARNVMAALPPVPGFGDGPVIDVEAVPVSELLTRPEDELSESGREWRQGWLDFTKDRTIRECLDGVFDGDPESRLKRCLNGKLKGGTRGEDRKDYPVYAARALAACLAHIGANPVAGGNRWEKMAETQKHEVEGVVSLFVAGLDTELVKFVFETAKEEAGRRKNGHEARPGALKASYRDMVKARNS